MKLLTKKNIEGQIAYQQKALKADDPEGTCAAHHRGYIRAMELVLEWVERDERNEQDSTDVGNG